jgi:hypothetical protein
MAEAKRALLPAGSIFFAPATKGASEIAEGM